MSGAEIVEAPARRAARAPAAPVAAAAAMARAAHDARCARASQALRALPAGLSPRLRKDTSNLFRDRLAAQPRQRLDLGDLDHVIEICPSEGWVDAEGGVTYDALVAATLRHGLAPCVVPQLRTITVGGALAGVAIEATSFRHGLVHHTMRELDVLLADGGVARCLPRGEHADLFHGFPNAYGTLGYCLRARLATMPVRPVVHVQHRRFAHPDAFIDALARAADDPATDFLDGVVFDSRTLVANVASFADSAPFLSDYGLPGPYWKSLLERREDHLRVEDWLWRWDTDWFWCSRQFGLERPWLRRLVGLERLNSGTYQRLMRWNSRWGVTRAWDRLRGRHSESVIQDVDLPVEHAGEFLHFLLREIGILPVWVCPVRDPSGAFPLYPMRAGALYLNFGFWDVMHPGEAHPPGHFNRRIEQEVMRLSGIKSLYSDCWLSREDFDRAYGGERYAALKARHDPRGRFETMYAKCVERH